MTRDADLIAQLRAARVTRKSSRTEKRDVIYTTDFDKLPEFNQLRIQRSAAELLKIDPPFYSTAKVTGSARIEIDNKEMLQFASYDYLGLNRHERVLAAAAETARIANKFNRTITIINNNEVA